MLIGFSEKTSKIWTRLFCRHFRHCVVLFAPGDKTNLNMDQYILIQIGIDGVRPLIIGSSEISHLRAAGWIFVSAQQLETSMHPSRIPSLNLLTCVGFAKRSLGIKNPFLWTPDQLYRYLTK